MCKYSSPTQVERLAKRYMIRCTASLIIGEIQVKTTMRYHLTPTMIAIIKKIDNEKYWQRYTYIGTLKDCGGSVKMMLPLWKRVWQIPKKLNIELPYDIASAPKKVGNMLCLVAQSCLTLCGPKDCSLQAPVSMRILQARILEWVAICFSRGFSQPKD